MQKSLKWSPAQPFKKSDNIISSKAREKGDYGFAPSYLLEPRENMIFLMSNEYMRMWFNERGKYEKDTYSKEEIIKEESKIKRRFVQRMMTYRQPSKNFFLENKLNKKTVDKTEKTPIDYSKMKYKPYCKYLHESDKGTKDLKKSGSKDLKAPQKSSVKSTDDDKKREDKKKEDKKGEYKKREDINKATPLCPVYVPVCCCTPTLPCGCKSYVYANQ
ncbi:uncharacterized protein LOC115891830 [Sitophilus oryzae]|uniref:Uncharacterized protein LOC115891830 n=1 Tax=Sitophilus oryzae TaxID=7048 RepID=A0A6J2YVW8_SITOR|nr:uncharacterized protein LOC115891830 [Sitophilus oryzae]